MKTSSFSYFRIDPRSLALFRILLGLILIADWFVRWRDIPAFYADTGIFPLTNNLPRGGGEWHFCILDSVRSVPMMQGVFLLGLAAYSAFLVGWKTRFATFASLLFFTGVVNRNILIRHGGDCAVMSLLIWCCFLHLGKSFSIDSRNAPDESSETPSLAPFFLISQLAMIYLATAYAKFGDDWQSGTALFYALSLENFSSPLGQWLVQHLPLSVIRGMSWSSLAAEWAVPFLIFIPILQPWPRRIAILLATALMGGIWLTMEVGDFPLVLLAANALLLSPQDWKKILRNVKDGLGRDRSPNGPPTKPGPLSEQSLPIFLCREGFLILIGAAFVMNSYNFNFTERYKTPELRMPTFLQPMVLVPQALQNWKMFAANPSKSDGWYVFDGITEDGQSVDPWNEGPVQFERPPNEASHRGRFWMKIYERLYQKEYEPYRLHWARYVTRRYNTGKPIGTRLKSFRIIYLQETNRPPGSVPGVQVTQEVIWHHECLPKTEK